MTSHDTPASGTGGDCSSGLVSFSRTSVRYGVSFLGYSLMPVGLAAGREWGSRTRTGWRGRDEAVTSNYFMALDVLSRCSGEAYCKGDRHVPYYGSSRLSRTFHARRRTAVGCQSITRCEQEFPEKVICKRDLLASLLVECVVVTDDIDERRERTRTGVRRPNQPNIHLRESQTMSPPPLRRHSSL